MCIFIIDKMTTLKILTMSFLLKNLGNIGNIEPFIQAKFKDFKIQNMVGSCDVKFPIRLEGLVLTHSQFSSYEPELFPGLIYRMVKPRIVLLIFVSGKVVLTGAKVRQEIYEAFDNIHPILKNFKKQ